MVGLGQKKNALNSRCELQTAELQHSIEISSVLDICNSKIIFQLKFSPNFVISCLMKDEFL